MSAAPEIRITTAGVTGECQECGRIDHGGPLALIRERRFGPAARVLETYVGECCQSRLVAEYRERDERGEVRFIDARTTGPEF